MQDRGWLIYREAILGLGNRNYSKDGTDLLAEIFDARPGREHWGKVGPWLKQHAKVVELTRQGAGKPALGFILGRSGSIDDQQVYPGYNQWNSMDDAMLVSVLLPHLSDLKNLANVLAADARYGREQGDSERVMSDVEALLKLGEQVHGDDQFVVVDLVAIGILHLALEQVEASLLDEKCRLSDEEFRKLAQMLSRPKVAADLVSFAGLRLMIQDVVQRCYTDDGKGDGHLTLEGQRILNAIGSMPQPGRKGGSEALHGAMITMLTPAVAASRKNVLQHYGRMMDLADANLKRPMREAKWKEYEQQVPEMAGDFQKMRRPMVILMAGRLANAQERAEKYLGYRDGVVVGIALELWRRRHGEWPRSLDVLAPEYLPSVPADRITGEAVKYVIAEGKPVVYSVGADRKDDGGRMVVGKDGKKAPAAAARWDVEAQKAESGDWVLYPQNSGAEER